MAHRVGGLRLFWTHAVQPHFNASRTPWLGVEQIAAPRDRPDFPRPPASEDERTGRIVDLKA